MDNRIAIWTYNNFNDLYSFPNSSNWFPYSELKKSILTNSNLYRVYRILEIGSYEGCSSCCFSDILLNDVDSRMICVDPFDLNDPVNPVKKDTKEIFLKNIKNSLNYDKITYVDKFSDDFFEKYTGPKFDFIYIDGAHNDNQIKKDLVNSLNFLADSGIIWCDDYYNTWKATFDTWYQENRDKVRIIHSGYQLAFQKIDL